MYHTKVNWVKPRSGHRGFLSLDALFSILPIVLMAVFVINLSWLMSTDSGLSLHRQQTFNKLVSVADHLVKMEAMQDGSGLLRPNWIDDGKLKNLDTAAIRKQTGLTSLTVSLGQPVGQADSEEMCIYRLVVSGQEKTITRLFVCGG